MLEWQDGNCKITEAQNKQHSRYFPIVILDLLWDFWYLVTYYFLLPAYTIVQR